MDNYSLSVLVKGASHDPVRRVKSLFDAISVMDVDVDVEYTRMVTQQLQDAQDDV